MVRDSLLSEQEKAGLVVEMLEQQLREQPETAQNREVAAGLENKIHSALRLLKK